VSRPDQAFQANAAAASAILLGMTLLMNAIAIWIRYRFRKRINWRARWTRSSPSRTNLRS
jgi:phosphate transport system permease protein